MKCLECGLKCKRRRIGVLAGGRSHRIKTRYCKNCDVYWRKYVGRWTIL